MRGGSRRSLASACAIAVTLTGCASTGGTQSGQATSSAASSRSSATTRVIAAAGGVCPRSGHALDGVYHPDRLTVLGTCVAARGLVERIQVEQDGDVHFDVRLDAPFARLLSPGNYRKQGGELVVELMPRDGGHLPEPAIGDRVSLVGAWVDDTDHDWNELHPVWSISIDGGPPHTSGPRFGGSAPSDRSEDAAGDCHTPSGAACAGYGLPAASGVRSPAPVPAGTPTAFCATHRCIPSFDAGHGTIVQCADGMWSHSGGERGACSRHGGVR